MRTRLVTALLHAGLALALPATASPQLFNPRAFDPRSSKGVAKNLQIIPKAISPSMLEDVMAGYSRQLGVKCVFCHVPDFPDKDDRPHKAAARRMMKMVLELNAKKVDYFGPRAKEGVVTCGTCHRGKAKPETLAH